MATITLQIMKNDTVFHPNGKQPYHIKFAAATYTRDTRGDLYLTEYFDSK